MVMGKANFLITVFLFDRKFLSNKMLCLRYTPCGVEINCFAIPLGRGSVAGDSLFEGKIKQVT